MQIFYPTIKSILILLVVEKIRTFSLKFLKINNLQVSYQYVEKAKRFGPVFQLSFYRQ